MNTTRRTVLRGLAALPMATVPALIPQALADPVGQPEAALIAQAARVVELAWLDHAAFDRSAELEDRYMGAEPRRPVSPNDSASPHRAAMERYGVAIMVDTDDVSRLVQREAASAYEAVHEQHLAAVEAWERNLEAFHERTGIRAARRLASRRSRRTVAAAIVLTAMEPSTLAGVVAKARAAEAVELSGSAGNGWAEELNTSVIRGVLAIGGCGVSQPSLPAQTPKPSSLLA